MTAGFESPVSDFTNLDQESLFREMTSYAQRTYTLEEWTDFNSSNEGTRLMELMAVMGEILSYTQNARFNEIIPIYARRERNFIAVTKSLAFKMKPATSGSTTLRIYGLSDGVYSFPLSRHQQFSTQDSVIFQPIADQTISSAGFLTDPSYGLYFDIDVVSGEEKFNELLGISNGQPGQTFKLANGPVIDGTLSVYVGADPYSEIDNLLNSSPSSKNYVRTIGDDGLTSLKFGDGTFGQIPPIRNIFATYKIGTGADADLPAGTINQIISTSDGSAVSSYLLSASVLNLAKTVGAGARQTLENAKESVPLVSKANNRAVSLSDYVGLSLALVPGVLKANAVEGRYQGGSAPVLLVCVPQGGGPVTPILYNQTVLAFRGKKMSGKRVIPTSATYVYLDISLDVYVQDTVSAALVEASIKNVLLTEYSLNAMTFAAALDIQHAYDILKPSTSLPGFDRVYYKRFTIIPYASRYLGLATTGNGDVLGLKVDTRFVQRREWNVKLVQPQSPVLVTRFEVRERHIGYISQVTDSFLTDEEANFIANELVGWEVRIRPLDNTVVQTVLANTQQTLTTTNGMLLYGVPDDTYVVQKLNSIVGKVLKTTLTVAATGTATVNVDSVLSWQVGDPVLVRSAAGVELLRSSVVGIGASSLTLANPVTGAIGTVIHYLWRSDDGSLEFAIQEGASLWVGGDELYVDTFGASGDQKLRPENFVLFNDATMDINTVGGIR